MLSNEQFCAFYGLGYNLNGENKMLPK
uniref:Uncharacterized protein n=1 Tax=Rhizophora mucronata TaxID=61149 RepID=A0A2P2QYG1_RHIMU